MRLTSKISDNKKLFVFLGLIIILIVSYICLCVYNFNVLKKYDDSILPNSYIDNYEISYFSYNYFEKKLDYYSNEVLSKKIKLSVNSQEVEYSLKDLGVSIDKKETINNIKKYQNSLSKSKKLFSISREVKNNFSFYYEIDDSVLNETLKKIKDEKDIEVVNGYFDTSEGVKYIKGVPGYSLNIDSSFQEIKTVLSKNYNTNDIITLVGDVTNGENNDSYETIDTMTSSFTTQFIPYTYLRNINLNTALGFINGTILQPDEIFSYCNTAGPFNRQGYVFYYEFVGNGVCQIATTTYNAALLGGLEIVKRYPHAKKSAYVPGGLDATVASYSSGWCVDMQFKNTYKYPIYIKAYSVDGVAHVEFWSNSNAKEGKEYQTSSTKIGARGYKSYLHTFENGEEIDVHEIATTWYTEE